MFLLGSCGEGDTGKRLEGPPSEPPVPGAQGDILKYEAARYDSLMKLSKDSFHRQKTEAIKPDKTLQEMIMGAWQWDKTICCGRKQKETRDTSAQKLTLFIDDHTIQYYRGKQLTGTKVYRLSRLEDHPTIRLEDNPNAAFLTVGNDTLIIDFEYMDLQTEYYIRVKQ